MPALDVAALLDRAHAGVSGFLDDALAAGRIDAQLHRDAQRCVIPNLTKWLGSPDVDRISPRAKLGIAQAIEAKQWEDLVNGYRRDLSFGTGGIRGMMAFDRASIERLHVDGIDAPILKGPNTLNNLVLLRVSSGVAKFGRQKGLSKIVIGYDTRTRGADFAQAIAELFLAFGYTVYLFDEPCPYPEVTFAIPSRQIKADLGILISASHNDYRYNGYKLSCGNGSQFDPAERDVMYREYIVRAEFSDVTTCPLAEASQDRLIWLGGSQPLKGKEYFSRSPLNLHDQHREHILGLLVDAARVREQNRTAGDPLRIGYCAYYGAGREAVPRLLGALGFPEVRPITYGGLNEPDWLFRAFCYEPGKEQQPDPGDRRAAKIAVEAFRAQYGEEEWQRTDIILGTDPDADRCGVIAKVPESQRCLTDGADYVLLSADDMWALILWFRLQAEAERHGGRVPDAAKKFIVQSVPTSDSIVRVARKFGLGVMKTWVGFANLAAGTGLVWDRQRLPSLCEGRSQPNEPLCHPFICEVEGMEDPECTFNCAAMEQSNGFSILGGIPPDNRSLGIRGHVRDKDGTFAAILAAEIAAYAKAHGSSLLEMVDKHVFLDPAVGLFVNLYEADPIDGEYPGIAGDRKKNAILRRALGLFQFAKAGGLSIGGRPVQDAVIYRTGKYDHVYPPTWDFEFPDEGIRFYFDQQRLDWLLVRPSGTGNSLRLHVQLHSPVNAANLIEQKVRLRATGNAILDDIRDRLGAPREA
jgi:phosphomannomutase